MTVPDPEAYRRAAHDQWSRSAAGWGRRADDIRTWALPVSQAMIDGVELQPGETVVELAAGPAETGLLAAEMVAPGGRVLISDLAEEMLDVARARAERQGVENAEFRRLDLEAIEIGAGLVDVVLVRWGVMLVADPAAAAREIRRILKPGGRAAVAVWDLPERNPWATIPTEELVEQGIAPARDPDQPGMFSLAAPGRLESVLQDAGFVEVDVEAVDVTRRHETADAYLDATLDLSRPLADFMEHAEPAQAASVTDGIKRRVAAFAGPGGDIVLPGRSLVARASA